MPRSIPNQRLLRNWRWFRVFYLGNMQMRGQESPEGGASGLHCSDWLRAPITWHWDFNPFQSADSIPSPSELNDFIDLNESPSTFIPIQWIWNYENPFQLRWFNQTPPNLGQMPFHPDKKRQKKNPIRIAEIIIIYLDFFSISFI